MINIYFLERGYAVLFLHRKNSLQPYVRHCMQHGTNFFEFLQLGPDGQAQGNIYTIRPYYDIRNKERKKEERSQFSLIHHSSDAAAG